METGQIILREATHCDIESMAGVAVRAWRYAFSSFLPATFIEKVANQDSFSERIGRSMENPAYRIVATASGGPIVGFASESRPCSLEGYDTEIGGFYVDPDASRSGVGRLLITHMAHHFALRGCRSLAIHTLEENAIGSSFYEKMLGEIGPKTMWEGFPGKWYVWYDILTAFSLESQT